jgi:EmrB/QacA subfamily drug resistance transporter
MTHSPPSSYRVTLAVLAVAACTFSLWQSLLVPALSDIQHELHTSAVAVSWLITGQLLSTSVFTPISGRLGDMFGKKRVLIIVLLIAAVGLLVAALGQSIELLILGRVLQGVGGGIFPLGFGIIRDEFPPDRVAHGIGLLSSLLGIGGTLGTVIAGPVIEAWNYHALFWIPLVVIVAAVVATWRLIPESPVRAPGRINWLATILMSIGLTSILVAISRAGDWGWGGTRTLVLIAFGAAVLVAWIWVELHSEVPLIDMRMMRIRGVWTTNLSAFMIGVGLYASQFLIPRYVQEPTSTGYGFGVSVVAAGLFLLPATIAQLCFGQLAGRLERRLGPRQPLLLGSMLCAVSFFLLAGLRGSAAEVCVATAIFGAGVALSFAALATLIVGFVRQDQTGVANGMNAVLRTTGGAVGAQLAATILTAHTVSGDSPTASGYTVAFGMCGLAGLIAVLATLLIPTRPRAVTPVLVEDSPAAQSSTAIA